MRVLATAGHVDHGKSTLVRALTGTDPDRLAEEKRRGLTIDLGFAQTALASGTELSFVDVPGHSRFLSNMLSGVGAVDACLFVVAATDGWMPQSEEHLRILELFGMQHGVIAITKRDLVDDDLAELAELDIESRIAGTFLADAPRIAVSAQTGAGMDRLAAELDALAERTPAATDRGRPRLWIDRVFAPKGAGTVVTGTLTGGRLHVDQTVAVQPGDHQGRIREIQTGGNQVTEIGPGHRVALNLGGISHGDLGRGDVVTEPDRWHLTDRFDATLKVLDSLDHPVSRRGAYLAYLGSREVPVKLRVLGDDAIPAGGDGLVRLFLPVTLPLIPGDRFVLREAGRDETVGGGEILDIAPIRKAADARPDRSVERVVRERGWVEIDALGLLIGEPVDPVDPGPGLVVVDRWVTTAAELERITDDLRRGLDDQPDGWDLSSVSEQERALLERAEFAEIDAGWVRPVGAVDPFADHPLAAAVLAGGFSPELPADHDRTAKRELVRRGVLVERDQVVFHADTVDAAAAIAAELLAADPAGFTVAQLRDRTATSRKYALALAAELDARGVTRRRDDLRIAGPRLPQR